MDVLALQAPFADSNNKFYLLVEYTQNQKRLEMGGELLPKLIEFYEWVYSNLAFELTPQQAGEYSMRRVLEVLTRHKKSEEYVMKLYEQVKGTSDYPIVCIG